MKENMKRIWKKRNILMKNKKGFTLIEMIIVIAIIAILIALIAPNLMKFLDTASQTKTDAAAKTLYTSAQTYATSCYIAGTPMKSGTYNQASPELETFKKEYFNSEELKEITSFEIVINGTSVEKVSVVMNDEKKSNYPKTAKDTESKTP